VIELLSEKLYSPTMGAGAAVSFQHPGAALEAIVLTFMRAPTRFRTFQVRPKEVSASPHFSH